MVYSYVVGNVTRDMSDEMILSRLIDQVGNKHIVIGRLEGNVSNIINAQQRQ